MIESNEFAIKPLSESLSSLFNSGFIVFCGAGVSIPPPSCSPSWWTLTEEILEAFFDRIPKELNLPTDMIIKDPDRQPEEVFETFANILDTRLYNAFEALDVAEPNNVHLVLAKLAKAKILKACFTTNFDLYFERALRKEGVNFTLLVENIEYENYFEQFLKNKNYSNEDFLLCKIHGTIDRPDTIISVASAYKSAKGFSAPKGQIFEDLISRYPCLFLGYSGWDFNHLNYRRFWERVGPQVKKVLWNKRPNEGNGPNFEEIFSTCKNKFQFTQAELPNDLIKSIDQFSNINLDFNNLTINITGDSSSYFNQAKSERILFFKKWAKEFPESHTLGLVMSESQKFSTKYREHLKKSREDSEETEAISYDFNTKMMELNQKMRNGEITPQGFQQQILNLQVENMLRGIKKKDKPIIEKMIQENKYPTVTDNTANLMPFLGYLRPLTRWFDLDKAAIMAVDFTKKSLELRSQNTDESRADLLILNMTTAIICTEEKEWKPFVEKMNELKVKYLTGVIDFGAFQKGLGEIQNEATKEQMGMTVDLDLLLEKQVEATANSVSEEDFEDQAEALSITTLQIGAMIPKRINESQEYKNIIEGLGQEILPEIQRNPNIMITSNKLDALDKVIRKPYMPVLERASNSTSNVKLLMEMAMLSLWINTTMYLDPEGVKDYTKKWENGDYPKHHTPATIYKYLKEKTDGWLDEAFKNLSGRFIQQLCGNIATLAEMGNDIELCKKATLKSFELSEGFVTEATPEGIPGILAAFYDRMGARESALKYYQLCLDAIKRTAQPMWTDAIIYRVAKLLVQRNDNKLALEIIGKYHPSFKGNAGPINMPARKLTLNLADEIANKLGYANANEAIDEILI